MKKLLFRSITFLVLFLISWSLTKYLPSNSPKKEVLSQIVTPLMKQQAIGNIVQSTVLRVVDGDTIDVLLNKKEEKVRVLGINTPETVDPRKPVECFGHEASEKAKSILIGQIVGLEADLTQDDRDKYGRLLRYVYLPDGTDFGLEMIKQGFAYEYTYDIPYKKQAQYKTAQKKAEESTLGLWNDTTCGGKK